MEKKTCSCCRYELDPKDIKEYDVHYERGALKTKKVNLCEVCAGSLISTFNHYPSQANSAEVIRIIGWGINYLRDEIRKGTKITAKNMLKLRGGV